MSDITIEILKEKIDCCSAGTFIKLNDNYLIDIIIGKTETNEYCFLVRGKTERRRVSQTNVIHLTLEQYGQDNKQLIFILKDRGFEELFLKLILDIYHYMYENGETTIDGAYKRWYLWKELFSYDKNEILSENKIQGLIGELLFLSEYMINTYGVENAILAWGGADYNKKDFEINNTWYEIKTVLNATNSIKISSIQQLDSSHKGYLVVYVFNKSTVASNGSINLNNLIDTIGQNINRNDIYDFFINKLLTQGYTYREEYNNFNIQVCEINYYLVDDNFPKLTVKNVPKGIKECTYCLDINEIVEFKKNIH